MSSSSNSSWTLLTPEETAAAETLRPLTEGTESQDEPSALSEGDGAQGLLEEDHLKAEETITKPCEEEDHSTCQPSSALLEDLQSPVPDEQTEDTTVDTALSNTEQEAFSDSYSHLSPSTEDRPAPPLTTETLGHLHSGQDQQEEQEEIGQTGVEDQTQLEELQDEESKEETEPVTQSPLQIPQEPSVQTEPVPAQEAEPEVRRRRSLLEKIGRHDEEEEAEEDFQLPLREDDSGITLNKCILGAVILLGLGTIFISESDYPSVEMKESEVPGKQEWLNPGEADSADLLNKLNEGNEQITILQSQVQTQNEELKVAQAPATEGSTEQLRQEQVEIENSRLKRNLESVSVLQKELKTMRTELESVSLLKKEVESLRSTLTQLKLSAAAVAPPGGRTEDNTHSPANQQVHRKDKHDRGVREEWKDQSEWKKEKKLRKDGGKMEGKDKEWKKDKFESGKSDKKHNDDKYSKHSEDSREQRKDKSKRGDEGKPWKEKKEKNEWTDRSDKKSKHNKFKDDKDWKSRQEWREFKENKHHGEKHNGPGDKEWKKGRDFYKEDNKEKYERKHWKEREGHESGNRKDNGDRREWSKDSKDSNKWKKRDDGSKWSAKEELNVAEKQHQKERREGKSEKQKESDYREHKWNERKPAHSHPKPSLGQPEYWSYQRERLQHSSKPVQPCDSPDTCAHTEGVRRVDFVEFEAILQKYLSKAQTAGVDSSLIDELKKIAAEMFQNGVFPHDQMSFQDYVEDLGDIFEDLVDGEDGNDQEDNALEDEMEGFEREVMQKFTLSGSSRVKGEWREESGRGRA